MLTFALNVFYMELPVNLGELYKKDATRAISYLYDTYYDSLFLFSLRMVLDPETAEDIIQDCFVDFWVNKRFEKLNEGLERYLFSAVKHASLNDIRNKKRRLEILDTIEHEQVTLPVIKDENEADEIERLYLAIERLPEERRKIFLMIFIDKMKYHEVAEAMGISVNTVKTQIQRALKFLREHFNNQPFIKILFLLYKNNSNPLSPVF